MKKIILSLLALTIFSGVTNAQLNPIVKQTISVPGLHCELDKDRIEKHIFKLDGIQKYKVDWKKKTVFVQFLRDRLNIETVRAEINNCGYDADSEKAEPTMKLRLPAACRVEVVVSAKPSEVAPVPPVKKVEPIKNVELNKPIVNTPSKKTIVTPDKKTNPILAPKKKV